MGPEESLWTDDDCEEALAWQEYETGLCSSCGHVLAESMAPENEFGYRAEAVRCHACAVQHRTVQNFSTAGGDTAGILVRMTKTPAIK